MDITERLSKLTPEQRKLLEMKLKQRQAGADGIEAPITRVERGDSVLFPLSFAQERLWFVDRLAPGNAAYNIVRATKLEGTLDIPALEKSLDEMVRRHEILRTTFLFENDEPRQVIHPVPPDSSYISLPIIDLKNKTGEEQASEVKQIKENESLYAFDLEKGPLLRAHLLELNPDEHVFLLVIHHIISDGISAEIFLGELIRMYRSFSAGETPALPALPVQYVDYAAWQRKWTAVEKYGEYWLNEFKGEIPVLEIPIDFPRPMMQSFEGDIVYFQLDAEIQKALKEIASREKTTLFVLLLTLYNIFLSKISGMEDIVVGSPAAGRRHKAVQEMIGIFINTLALRNFPEGNKRFIDFLSDVRMRTLKAFENQEYRYEDIVDKVAVVRDTGRNPLFDVVFVMQNQEAAGLDIPGLRLSPLPYQPRTSKFDLSFEVIVEGDSLRFSFEYCTALFKEETVQRFSNYFINIVSAVVRDPEICIGEIDVIDEGERERLLSLFNTPGVTYPGDKTIHRLFEEQAEQKPGSTALLLSRETDRFHLSYSLLNRDAGRLASLLRERGLVPGTIAALLTERSFDMITGILAILKAGGGYLPIDPDTPRERIEYLLADSAANVLLVKHGPDSKDWKNLNAPVVLDFENLNLDSNYGSLTSDLSSSSLAYVIYTSGTTGRPKGGMIEHRNVVQLMFNNRFLFDFDGRDVWTLFHSYNFDFSVWEMYGALLYGGKLRIIPKMAARDTAAFLGILKEEYVTVLNQTPSSFYHLSEIEMTRSGRELNLRYIIFGGEALAPGRLKEWRGKYPKTRLINMYGITETTVHVTYKEIGEREISLNESNIGQPLPPLTACVVNRFMKLVPVGVPGELLVGGAGVSRGYLNRPNLTLEKFDRIDWENRSHLSNRTYHTGDLAKVTSGGELVYLGRIDHQVKIRGHRIEPGEIEKHLEQHEAVKTAVVIDREDEHRERYLCAYIVPNDKSIDTLSLRSYLAGKLPAYMIPSYFITLERIPVTSTGKVDTKALRRMDVKPATEGMVFKAPRNELEKMIGDAWKEVLGRDEVGIDNNFFDLGGTSFDFVKLSARLKKLLGEDVPVVTLFQNPTVGSLAQYLSGKEGEESTEEWETEPIDASQPDDIAVIGMSARVPGARNIDQFWENLKNGVEGISFFSSDELKDAGIADDQLMDPGYVKAGGILEGKDAFDFGFFDYLPAEAEIMDPQMRLLHEYTWEALENAGYTPDNYRGTIGLYAGSTQVFDREMWALVSGTGRSMGYFDASQYIKRDFLVTRIAYKLNLTGPAVLVQSACSTSLLAIHTACRALASGECDMAAAGGVTLGPGAMTGYIYREGMVLSPDGHCRAFDANAKGLVGGEGVGIVVLKRLRDALADGDTVYAVVKGSAVNNDGKRKAGYTAPAVEGQVSVIKKALRAARCIPESISYVETHGTATILGDPIEIKALTTAFNTRKRRYCAVGSVKTNVGHLDSAAGVTGFIKTVLSLKHRLIPPSLHFESPNPAIDFENSPFFVNTIAREWKNEGYPLRAGVSSFGIGGTNVHVVLEEPPGTAAEESTAASREYQLLLLSAKTGTALDEMTRNLARYFKENRPGLLADAAYTLQVGRKALPYRRRLVCEGVDEAVEILSDEDALVTRVVKDQTRPVVFLFSGLGGQYENMGLDLYLHEPLFQQEMDRCFDILTDLTGHDFKGSLYLSEGEDGAERSNRSYNSISQSDIAQIAVFIFEYSLARLLMSWGVKPDAMIGYSFGEYAAACIAGVFSLEDALVLIVSRGELMERTMPGVMLSVPLTAAELEPLLKGEEQLSLSIDNGPSCVVGGLEPDIENFENRLKEKRIMCMRLPVSRAVHSHLMEPVLKEFGEKVSRVTLKPLQIPLISNVTGTWMGEHEAADHRYWVNHLRHTVRFASGVEELIKKENAIFIEIGPGRDITTLLTRYKDEGARRDIKTVNLVRPPKKEVSDVYYLLNKIGELWLYGLDIDWKSFHGDETRRRIPLPSYPFQRHRFPVEGDVFKMAAALVKYPSAERKDGPKPLADRFYVPLWKKSQLKEESLPDISGQSPCLLFLDGRGVGKKLSGEFEKRNINLIIVRKGENFAQNNDKEFTLNPSRTEEYDSLFDELRKDGLVPASIVHLWGVSGDGIETIDDDLNRGFYSLVYLAQAIGKMSLTGNINITVITDQMQDVSGNEVLSPAKSAVLGPVTVIPQEMPNILCRSIDILVPPPGTRREQQLIEKLTAEILTGTSDPVVAYRGNRRWVRTFDPLRLEGSTSRSVLLEKGVYLITGGLGEVGLLLAQYLARTVHARLVLTGRSQFPPGEEWDSRIAAHEENDPVSRKIEKIRQMEAAGGEVFIASADAASLEQMRTVFEEAETRFGTINGVIHAAGTARGEFLQSAVEDISQQQCMEQFHAKVYGLPVLETLLEEREIDFCLLMSSLSGVLGGLGFTAYAAANIFMDAFAAAHNNNSGTGNWYSVNWDGWQSGDEAEDPGAMPPGEGEEVFRRILDWGEENRVVVSLSDLQSRIDKWVLLKSLREETTAAKSMPFRVDRPELSVPYAIPRNPVEQSLVEMWQAFFGLARVGIDDDFIELGGDSLKAVTMIARMQKELAVRVSLPDFFDILTIRGLAEHIQKSTKETFTALESVDERDYYPLSAPQKRMYILNLFMEYTIFLSFQVEGNLDPERVEKVFNTLIERHEALRTSFHTVDGEPVQRIHSQVDFHVESFDIADPLPAVNRPFDISQAPLMRVGTAKLSENRHLLFVKLHHLISDGVTLGILSREFTQLYGGETLPVPAAGYREFSMWQDRMLRSDLYREQETYWLDVFSGELPVLNMALDYPRPAMQSFDGRRLIFYIDRDRFQAFKKLALAEGASFYMVLLAVYQSLLHRYTGQEDIIVGTITAGRDRRDLENIAGIFINPQALRCFPSKQKTFREFLAEVKQHTLEAHEHSLYPFGDLLDNVVKEKDHGRNPLFDVMLAFQNRDVNKLEIGELKFSWYEPPQGTGLEDRVHVQQDLTLWANEEEDRIRIDLEYCTALFKHQSMERLAGHFMTLLDSVAANPVLTLSELEMITEGERRQLESFLNTGDFSFPRGETFHGLFEEQAKCTPDSIAVTQGSREITYRELNRRAGSMAGALVSKGAKPGDITAIMPERSIEMYIGILGVLKSGGAYLPVDTSYPSDRIDYMLADSAANVLLIKAGTGSNDRNSIDAPVVLDIDGLNFGTVSGSEFCAPELPPSSPAYIIYTSGSTGRPKGVVVGHDNFVNAAYGWIREYRLKEIDVNLLQVAGFSFDVFSGDMARAFLSGGRLVVCPEDVRIDFPVLYKLIRDRRISLFESTPALILPLMEFVYENKLELPHLQLLILGSDVCPPGDFRQLVRRYREGNDRGMRIINSYGVTEATIDSSFYEESPAETASEGNNRPIPIGKPLPNVVFLILDPAGNLQPVGVPGELYIGGAGIASGYLNNPELTAEKFNRSYTLFYRSGDLARWLDDGNVEFLGRADYQVKIRGFRIETGEIEDRLLKDPRIEAAVVLDRDHDNGEKYLCAYIVPSGGKDDPDVTIDQLRQLLRTELPEYMVPASFIRLDEIPLTPNGKIDRKALRSVEVEFEPGSGYTPPASPVERELAAIWAEILKKEPIGSTDNFFNLGGHSLLAMRAVSKIREVFNVNIPLIDFFRAGTLREVAALIVAQPGGEELEIATERKGLIQPFELYKAPLFRASVVKLKNRRHFFFIDIHHIVTDGMSLDIIAKEFITLYRGNETLEDLPVQYRDFSQWQGKLFSSEYLERRENYWLNVFRGDIPRLSLPSDFPRPDKRKGEGRILNFHVPVESVRPLKELAARREVTLFMLLLAVFNVLLSKLTREEDIIVGTPVSGRTHDSVARVTGMFVNTLALRNQLGHALTFTQFLGSLKEKTLSAMENQDYPFEMLVEKLDLSGDAGHNPLFDTMFTVLHLFEEGTENSTDNPLFIPYEVEYTGAMFDLVLGAVVSNSGLRLEFTYDIELFKEETIRGLGEKFKTLIAWILQAPAIRIEEIDIHRLPSEMPGKEETEAPVLPLTDAQREWILNHFNNTRVDYPTDITIHRLFENQVEASPSRIAAVAGDRHLTYRELDRKALQLAALLQVKGLESENCVGLMMERSVEMMWSALGILKAGGCYMPLKPDFPADRIKYLLKDSNATILLMNYELNSKDRKIICPPVLLNVESPDFESVPVSGFIAPEVSPLDLAVVIYTSGTTGRPKGALVGHGSLVNRLAWMDQFYQLTAGDFILQKTSISFDVSITELFGWFYGGASICFLEPEGEKDMRKIADTIENRRITSTSFTPTVLHTFLRTIGKEGSRKLKSLKWILCGGEQIPKDLEDDFLNLPISTRLENMYGPTETVVYTTYFSCGQHPHDGRVPVGKPLANTRIYILDEHMELLPPGAAGELYIGGDVLSRGYLNRPLLTAEKFIPDPFYPGGYMYRTGDHARLMPDGNIVYMGRKDDQVKIKGVRIELGEIEAVLREHPDIIEAAVIDPEDSRGMKFLAAYIVLRRTLTFSELQAHLLAKFPDVMVPSVFVHMDKMPLSASGKLNRRALPGLGTPIEAEVPYTAPRNEIERQLVDIWIEGLGIEKIGIENNFFEIGGDSLRANLVLTKINRRYGTSAAVRDLLEAPTIRQFAEILSKATPADGNSRGAVPIEKREYYPASSSQKRLFIVQGLNGDHTAYNHSMGMFIQGQLDEERLKEIVNQLIRRHESLRTGFEMRNGELVQRVYEPFKVNVPFYVPSSAYHGEDVEEGCYIERIIKGDVPLRPIGHGHTVLEPAEEMEYYPLSSAQKRMYIVQHMDMEDRSYNIPAAWEIRGIVDPGRLQWVFRELIQRHEILRTSFHVVGDTPVQRVHRSVNFYVEPLPDVSSSETGAVIRSFTRPFNFTAAPLLRAGFARIGEAASLLIVDMHHIVGDGFSFDILVRDFIAFYNRKEPAPLSIRYRDFALWQERRVRAGEIDPQKAYWHRTFRGDIPLLNLPTDRPRPPERRIEAGDTLKYIREESLAAAVSSAVESTGSTPFLFSLAVFYILLARYSRQEDIVVGSPIAGRRHPALQDMIGVFLNMIPLRNFPNGFKSFRRFLEEVRTNTLEAFENEDYPFDELVFDLGLQGNPGRSPLFDVEFAYHTLPGAGEEVIEGISLTPCEDEQKFAKFDLHFLLLQPLSGGNVTMDIRYSTDLFDRDTVEKLKDYYEDILRQVSENPDVLIDDIRVEHRKIAVTGNIHSADTGDFEL